MTESLSFPPTIVAFEGVDGVGKSSLSRFLAQFYSEQYPSLPVYAASFPGSIPGTIGEWVYRLHHDRVSEIPAASVSPGALQSLHVASHIDTIQNRITPWIAKGGVVILDRYWWSTYAYSRRHLTVEAAWAIVGAEIPFWQDLPTPVVVYLTRESTLKQEELSSMEHLSLDAFYRELIAEQVEGGSVVHEISNDDSFEAAQAALLVALGLNGEGCAK